MKRCVVISDSFKGTLSSSQICALARQAARRVSPELSLLALPVADGGEGTVDCFLEACGGRWCRTEVFGPFGERVQAAYGLLPDGTAVVECAAAAGLPLAEGRLDVMRATTYGVGQLIRDALSKGAKRLVLGLGGSCTNDGGCGCAAVLGVRFTDRTGAEFIPAGGTLEKIDRVDVSRLLPRLREIPLTVMCDIDNPLYGPDGAACVFAPQKGADARQVQALDRGLRHLAQTIERCLGVDVSCLPGAGAAGGFGAGCVALLGGKLQSGIETVLDTVDFDGRIRGCDLVITGEGRLDSQSLGGKVVSGVARRCHRAGVPVVAVVGAVDLTAAELHEAGLAGAVSINPAGMSFQQAREHAADFYENTLERLLRTVCAPDNGAE